jgi:hypothetical protein
MDTEAIYVFWRVTTWQPHNIPMTASYVQPADPHEVNCVVVLYPTGRFHRLHTQIAKIIDDGRSSLNPYYYGLGDVLKYKSRE